MRIHGMLAGGIKGYRPSSSLTHGDGPVRTFSDPSPICFLKFVEPRVVNRGPTASVEVSEQRPKESDLSFFVERQGDPSAEVQCGELSKSG